LQPEKPDDGGGRGLVPVAAQRLPLEPGPERRRLAGGQRRGVPGQPHAPGGLRAVPK
ncbi:unnamed protein product, partial [Heterosigma akashiwo]